MVERNPSQSYDTPGMLAHSQAVDVTPENCKQARALLAEHFQPFVCVFSTKLVQQRMMEVNGLTPAEFFRPFGRVGNCGGLVIRTCEKTQPYVLTNFRVNFVDSHLMHDHPKASDQIPVKIMQEYRPEVQSHMADVASFSNRDSKQAVSRAHCPPLTAVSFHPSRSTRTSQT